jgi:uncharacterized OB-fold protein
MGFCKACGNEVVDSAVVCVKCGSSVAKESKVEAWSTGKMWGYSVLSFLIPLIGIIFGIIGLTKEERRMQGGILMVVSIFALGFWSAIMK